MLHHRNMYNILVFYISVIPLTLINWVDIKNTINESILKLEQLKDKE